ncbi:DUF1353 domain-containing protein [Pelagibius litoralis]|uniref:DUF1353 domain-containing protein n=1 Tax=Pelagibius litoralis TaxID=374515 RepID=A0A967KFW9_9PROT|nr:DUF1353 domain-containing protein [Pelagibius litoralis]NIA71625.1 DUF1353 domain-containing protein [Pelagibius litoralis]
MTTGEPGWDPGPDPFPQDDIRRIADFEYLDELKFLRHAKVHVRKTPESLWQLAADFRVAMTVHLKDGGSRRLTIKAPRGLFTDLASVPQALWAFAGPIGRHLEASVVHDYLYMAWTDFRDTGHPSLGRNRHFADAMFLAGMTVSKVAMRCPMYLAVRTVGGFVFRRKPYSLKQRMEDWLPLLDDGHGRSG